MNNTPYLINIDWFQVACKDMQHNSVEEGMAFQGTAIPNHPYTAIYQICRGKEFNPIFADAFGVVLHGFQLATIYLHPRPSSLPESLCSIKMSNRILYSGDWAFYLVDIARALGWRITNITRCDLACDFTHFSGGLHPRTFIERYLQAGEYDPLRPSYYRKGSNKYFTIGKKEIRSEVFSGTTRNFSALSSEYLRFGSRSTGVSVYLYNKSKELATQKDKSYIVDCWIKSSIIPQAVQSPDTAHVDEQPDVFRLEISVNSSGLNVKRVRDPEDKREVRQAIAMISEHIKPLSVDKLAVDDFLCQKSIEEVFWAYANKYFAFKIVGPQKYKHHWADLRLFDVNLNPTIKPYSIGRSFGSGVSERNAVNTIRKLLNTIHDLSLPEQVSLDNAASILERWCHVKGSTMLREDAENCARLLRAGHSFDELKRMGIAAATHIEQMKEFVHESIIHELREIMTDRDNIQAITNYEATQQLIAEQAEVIEDWWANEWNPL